MTTPLTIDSARRDDGRTVLTAVGEIDLSNIDAFRSALTTATDDSGPLTVDLSAVEYLDSAAINVLFDRAEGIDALIAHAFLMSPLTISGLTELVAVESAGP
ncbi:STAS domain-containing protein [Mycobacterium sp. GA-2829]|uniref:STAS domain-containing protein n=1 Tax=Mycobacterium sp. GA-2829 TaxID=1772283 RepID=UPI00073FF879|nr:STAS domain-containing protein [Mycobacterium sp. GA-2829]KUI38047.1 anti-anti-sigma factor [Mycobacterium sp. GA-2829]